ncbi:PH domain-containing protein [Propionibacteriaceae bacterium Y1685]|uniref:PH domain-containing protein n=1 Tax=Microlunatus sp. Y1700 TaxID=3418487 RepID=UPI003B7A2B5C
MSLPRKLLGADETVELHLRTHLKKLFLPALVLILLGGLVGVAVALMPPTAQPWGGVAVAVVALVIFIAWVLVPFLRWRTTTFTVTDRRIITRTGLLNQTGHDLPLVRINDVSYERSLSDRILGCGSLHIRTAADQRPLVLDDVPDVERVHVTITELLFDTTSPTHPTSPAHQISPAYQDEDEETP